jgi:outer membrane protein OmpA-like peptidoglycan-associated protein
MKTTRIRALSVALSLGAITLLLHACGSSAPTQQLVDARRAYDQAQMSAASKLTPDQLLTAHQALQAAERAHRDHPGSTHEAHLAYLAERKAEQAMAFGKIAQAKQTESQAKQEYLSTLEHGATSSGAQLAREKSARAKAEEERKAADERAAAAVKELAEIAQVSQEERGIVLTIPGAVLFAQGKSVLSTSARGSLEKVAQVLQQQPSQGKFRVEGYTDSRGSDAVNAQLSQERAEAVRDYLVQRGVDANQVEALGLGKANPIASNDTAEGRATNRRVEIVIPTQAEPIQTEGVASSGNNIAATRE